MKKLFFLFFTLTVALGLQAQEVSITEQQVPAQVSFAQPFDVRFEVAHTPGYNLQLDKDSLPKDFTLTHEQLENPTAQTSTYQLTFLPFTLGVSTFTAVNIQLQDNQGQVVAQTASKNAEIDVKPVQFYKEKTLRDIRPPYIPWGSFTWLMCLLALIALIWVLRHFTRRVKQDRALLQQEQDNRPADVIALSKIRILLQSGLWEKAQYKAFYIELGDILREYFWRRFHLDVSSDTSAELLRRARQVEALKPLLQGLRDYLSSSDLVKFAKVVPSQNTMQQDVKTVEHLVRTTSVVTPEISDKEDK